MIAVTLNEFLAKEGLGFSDPITGAEIRQRHPGKPEEIKVPDSSFVRDKIKTGELRVSGDKDNGKKSKAQREDDPENPEGELTGDKQE